ncbi:MAG TPA: GGDEF domain-containing protein [Longimicrobiales bacterium]|nr:GGDEF domain-containing protein [Longimicrobiales bacterium]
MATEETGRRGERFRRWLRREPGGRPWALLVHRRQDTDAGGARTSPSCTLCRALQGMALAVGAPLGWLLIQRARGVPMGAELSAHPGLYLYMLLGTLLVFGAFGLLLGEREARLLRSARELEELAVTDSLTGLRNARYFHARLEEADAERERAGEPLALAVLDLDHFKRINDEHGHPVGDEVLAAVARAIADVTREGETEARVGGEEFALLLPGSTGEAAREVADRVRAAIAAVEIPVGGAGPLRVTASAGVASTAELGDVDPRELYRAADEALYRAKELGRDRTVVAASG